MNDLDENKLVSAAFVSRQAKFERGEFVFIDNDSAIAQCFVSEPRRH
jgi:hypothetical protein